MNPTSPAPRHRTSLTARAFLCLTALASALAAQDAPPPPPPEAKALGPQSVIETYDAPVEQTGPLEGMIDFPSLIAAPGPNDGLAITDALGRLELEMLGTSGNDSADAFIPILGTSRVAPASDRDALYAALRDKLAVYRDQPLTLGDVRFIQQDITEVYGELGYPLMAVVVPPQEIIDRTLRVQINEFALSAYRVVFRDPAGSFATTATHWSNEDCLATLLDPLLDEPILGRTALDAAVQRINRNPYRQARVVFEPGAERGQSIATVQVEERRPWGLQAGYNNYATKASGTHRFSLGGSVGNVPVEDHQLSWNATVGTRLDAFQNYSLIYTVPLDRGQQLSANINYSDTASSSIPGINSASTTLQASLTYNRPLWRNARFDWSFAATGFLKQFERESIFGDVAVGGASFDSVQVQLNSPFSWREATASNQLVFGAVLSFEGVTDRNTDADFRTFYNSATGRAETQHFSLNYARVQQLGPLLPALEGWSAETQVSWQWTARELAGSDAFAIGGSSVLRAYPASALSGDNGIYLVQMLHLKPWTLDGTSLANPWINQVAVSPLLEAGWAGYRKGGEDHVWDAGVQVALRGARNLSVTASLAIAGEPLGTTERGDAHLFVGARWAY